MEDDVQMEIILVEPKLHDRWSLLLLAASMIADVSQTISNNLSTGAMMMAQHRKQKEFDKKFREIVK